MAHEPKETIPIGKTAPAEENQIMSAPSDAEPSSSSELAGGTLRQDRRKILNGALWTAGDFWLQQLSQFLTFVVVGNILGPSSVGVMTMGLTAILFAWAF